MGTKYINGFDFENLIKGGLINLQNNEKEVNSLNVFPVADGDTGTNMKLTLQNGINKAESNIHLGLYLKSLSSGMLLGARGNSGVILSQLFKGLAVSLTRYSTANGRELCNAFTKAYQTAYKVVVNPVEGTLLTVSREGVEGVKSNLFRGFTIENFFSMYAAEIRKSLDNTPNLLPILKESGVIDSGGYGYLLIIEGMKKVLNNEKVELNEELVKEQIPSTIDYSAFNEDSNFSLGYCLEFLLQLMNSKNGVRLFKLNKFIDDLKIFGNSIECFKEGTIVKVHIHTLRPSKILDLAQEYGEFISLKLENMQIQADKVEEEHKEKLPHSNFGIISVYNGEGFKELYEGLGASILLNGGNTMNTSTEDFLNAFDEINSDRILIIPNNSNIHKAAMQAINMYKGESNISIVPTKNLGEGYFALAMGVNDPNDIEYWIRTIENGYKDSINIEITKAVKDFSSGAFKCLKGNYLSLINNELSCSSSSLLDTLYNSLLKIENLDEKSSVVVFKGQEFNDELEEGITEIINKVNGDLEINFVDGGENIFEFIVGII